MHCTSQIHKWWAINIQLNVSGFNPKGSVSWLEKTLNTCPHYPYVQMETSRLHIFIYCT